MSNLTHDFDYIKINLASPKTIKKWGTRLLPNGINVGEIRKSETINYRTFKPEMDGLFCEKIFGPIKNWECYCGKYKKIEPKEFLICDRCDVEVTESRVRRHRMGFIELLSPVTHVWYLKGIPSYLSLFLKRKLKILEEVIYFNSSLNIGTSKIKNLKTNNNIEANLLNISNNDYILQKKSKIGAEAIKFLLDKLSLNNEIIKDRLALSLLDNDYTFYEEPTEYSRINKNEKREKLIRRIRLIENFLATDSNPNWMILDILPVIPAGLRPMVQLDGGRFATSDLNELYRRVINRNNRLERLFKLYAPLIIIYNEKRMLQEAIDALIDNGKRGRKALGTNNRSLKSLSDIIEGKQGRFRQNLLGKRVDYSGRSVIIVSPSLKLHECGLPREMASELFQPFLIHKLITNGLASNMKLAKKLIQNGDPIIWEFLKSILKDYPILLNRAPTLHRLGIQAFEPKLVDGLAIHLHPLVCNAFNADFDGDQMAVHIPLSLEAKEEAKNLLLAPNNFISPANGEATILPSQDMVLGCYYLTLDNPICIKFQNRYFSSYKDGLMAYEQKKISLHTPIWIRTSEINHYKSKMDSGIEKMQISSLNKNKYIRTTIGRIILNNTIYKNLYL
jgi:DNA-directed RNA polymerase subunit beta'